MSNSAENGNSPAYPLAWTDIQGDGHREFGMSKRERIATDLFAAMITTSGAPALLGIGPGEDQFARAAVKLADVLLQELAK